jgi:hypothetical protein
VPVLKQLTDNFCLQITPSEAALPNGVDNAPSYLTLGSLDTLARSQRNSKSRSFAYISG